MMTRTAHPLLPMVLLVALGCGVWAASTLPDGGRPAVVGGVVGILAVCGLVAGSQHLGLYTLGAAVLLVALVVGLVESPLADPSATGFCVSVFFPDAQPEDAPPGVTAQCEQARRQHGIVVGALTLLGVALMLSTFRSPGSGDAADAD